ncbi:autotransporter outer membrane beta-barrel domain-containing protein [Bradyrhizobium guangxiense]
MSQFLGLLTDPGAQRDGGPGSAGGAAGFVEEDQASAYAAGRRTDAFAMLAKAPTQRFAQRWSVWAAGFGGSQSTNGNATDGSNDMTSRIAGMAVGADYWLAPNTKLGFALAGGGTSFGVNALGSGRSDLFQAGAYLRHSSGPAYLSAALAYGWQDITTDRTVTIAGTDRLRAEFNANAYSGRLEGGYRFIAPWVGGIGLTPYGAAQFTTFDLPAYTEQVISGTGAFALNYASKSVTDTRGEPRPARRQGPGPTGRRDDAARSPRLGARFQSRSCGRRDLSGATARKLRRQRRSASSRCRAYDGFGRDEMDKRLVRGGDLRGRVLERHPQLRRQGQRPLRLVSAVIPPA